MEQETYTTPRGVRIKNKEFASTLRDLEQSHRDAIASLQGIEPVNPQSPLFQELRKSILEGIKQHKDEIRMTDFIYERYTDNILRALQNQFLKSAVENIRTGISPKKMTTESADENVMQSMGRGAETVIALTQELLDRSQDDEPVRKWIKIYANDPAFGESYERDFNHAEILGVLTAMGLDPDNLPEQKWQPVQADQIRAAEKKFTVEVKDDKQKTRGILSFTYRIGRETGKERKLMNYDVTEMFIEAISF